MTLILVFGPSTTYGAWDVEGGWVQRLRRYLDEKQLADPSIYYIVYNLGISGDTSQGLLERFAFETEQRTKLRDEDEEIIIIFSIGVNDSLFDNTTKQHSIPLEQYTLNLQKLIDQARRYTKNIIFVGGTPIDDSKVDPVPWRPTCSYKSLFEEQYDEKCAVLCKKNKIPFIDVYHPFKKQRNYLELLPDGVHPTAEGYKFIFEVVKNFLLKHKIL
ncbi:MAG TPA: GDSL-type esterase/lipase family protein [Candidatus Nanoarchaeia archaeon]|nr:GDSL-type esterase/lipase family protein [Candidatus Nanoarchaeia archaeon]